MVVLLFSGHNVSNNDNWHLILKEATFLILFTGTASLKLNFGNFWNILSLELKNIGQF